MGSTTRRQIIIGGTSGLVGLAATGVASNAQNEVGEAAPATSSQRAIEGRFNGKVVFITGATSGIGRATAIAFAREGAKVAFCGRRTKLGAEVESEIKKAGGAALFVKADVMNEEEIKAFINATVKAYGRIDIAFNNAGYEGQVVPFTEQTLENWDTVMNTNARGVFLSMLYEIPQMLKQGGGGVIINNASTSGHIGFPVIPAYVASKHAIIGLTKSAALAHPKDRIRVNSISPGFIDTAQVDRFVGGDQAKKGQIVRDNVPLGRIGQVEEVAKLVMWLSTNDSPFINGADIVIDGGDLA